MSDGHANGVNPFVGPRAFEAGEHLYGRDREARHLVDLLIAKRVVLLHSPSGAGKTSLILAKIVPMLNEEDFAVRRVMRVNLSPPDLGATTATPNRYVMSALLCLEEALPPAERLPVAALATHDLASYLAKRRAKEDPGGFEVLVFDQFEEILTLDPSDRQQKEEFFAQIAAALEVEEYWALFSIREDYLAALGPYAPVLPTRLKTTFRLDLLGETAAREAIQGPVRGAGVEFDDEAARKLVDDLRQTQIQLADGSTTTASGPYVEPVQLQVVCRRLWQHLPAGTKRIELSHLEALGSVDLALGGYYRDSVKQVAAESGTEEQKIRRWFEHQLITPQGIRGQVLKAKGESAGLDAAAISALVDTHLVRGEQRRGATWYELAHDRLIEPILQDNAEWFAQNVRLSPLQIQARLWNAEGRSLEYLELAGGLEGAEAWANEHPDEMTDVEHAFLRDYRQRTNEQERKRDRVRRRWIWLSSTAAVLALIAAVIAVRLSAEADDARDEAHAQQATAEAEAARAGVEATKAVVAQETAEAQANRLLVLRLLSSALEQHDNGDHELGALLARQAFRFAQDAGSGDQPAIDAALRTILAESHFSDIVPTRTGDRLMAISADGETIAIWGNDSTLRISNLHRINSPKILQGFGRYVPARVVLSPDGGRVVSIGSDGVVWTWDLRQTPAPRTRLAAPNSPRLDGTFSDDGTTFAAFDYDLKIWLWDFTVPTPYPRVLEGHRAWIMDIAIAADGNTLASTSQD